MSEAQLRERVRHFLRKEAEARSGMGMGGDLNYNPGLLIGDGRRPGRPRKVGRPKVVHHRAQKGGAVGNPHALSEWRHFFEKYRLAHPHLPYRQAQKMAAAAYKK